MTLLDTEEARYDDGRWYVVTLGHFIGLLVDAGHDPAVRFRVVGDTAPDESGAFIRRIELLLLPDGAVAEAVAVSHRVHKTLQMLLERGVVR